MRIYTRTGDGGDTSLFGGGRVRKDDPRVRAYGTVDELNALLGRAVVVLAVPASRDRLALVQHDLFAIGAHLATPPARGERVAPSLPPLPEPRTEEMESWIDEVEEALEPLERFVLPGGSAGAGELHVCRTVCRRAEREVVALADHSGSAPSPTPEAGPREAPDPAIPFAVRYLNRLSDLLFVLARRENLEAGVADVEWSGGRGGSEESAG